MMVNHHLGQGLKTHHVSRHIMSQAPLVLLGTTMVMAVDGHIRVVVDMCGDDQGCW